MSADVGSSILAVGAELLTTWQDEEVIMIGTEPYGLPAILNPQSLAVLRAWKLKRLRIIKGQVRAGDCGQWPLVSRFLTAAINDTNSLVKHRNGYFLDLRLSNLVVVPRETARQVRNPRPQATVLSPTITSSGWACEVPA